MLVRMDEQVAEFNDDQVMQAIVNTERSKYKNIVSTYLTNFKKADSTTGVGYPVNKAVATFDSETGLPVTYVDPISIAEATEAGKRGVYKIGDIMNLKDDSGNQLIAVWTGSEWEN